MTTPHRVAIIGLGEAGFTLHLPALAALPSARVVGVCDSSPERLARAAQRYAVPTFDEAERMMVESAPDVVIVATPPATHAQYCASALSHQMHVFCEKPFTCSDDQARELMSLADANGVRIALNHQFRFMPIYRAVVDRLNAVGATPLVFAQVWQQIHIPPGSEAGWRGQLVERTLFEAGIHLLDLTVALFGEFPVAVTACMSRGREESREGDGIVTVALEFSRGRLASLVQNRVSRGERQYLEVRADTGDESLRASFGGRARLTVGLLRSRAPHLRIEYGASGVAWSERGARRVQIARNPGNPGVSGTRILLEQTLDAFRTGTEVPVSATFARQLLQVTQAAYRSAETGRRIVVESDEVRALASRRLGGG